MVTKRDKKNKKIKNKNTSEKKAKDPVQKAQGTVAKQKSKRSTPARSGHAIKVSAKDGQSYADILKEMKAKVDHRKAGLEVLSILRTRKEELLLVLKKGGDVSAFRNELDRMVGVRAEISALVATRSLEIRDLNETVEKKEVVSALCLALGRPALHGSCRLFTRFGGVKTTVIQLGKIRIRWVACRIREHAEVVRCFRCLGYGHRSRGCCNSDRKMPVGDAVPQDTWPGAARQRRGA